MKIDQFFFFLIFRSCAVRLAIVRKFPRENLALRQCLPICTQIIPSLRAAFKFQDDPFRLRYYILRIGFYTVELPILWP